MTVTTADISTEKGDDRKAKHNVIVLAAAQAIGGSSSGINMAIASLVGYYLLGEDKSWATLPITAFVIGLACGTVPAALLMRRIGRRPGFIIGMMFGAVGALIEAWSLVPQSFVLLCVGAWMTGVTAAFVQQFRFAAADTASPSFRPKAISWVLIGGVFAAIIGPQTVILTHDMLAPIPFAGAFLASAALMIVAALVLTFLDIPKPPKVGLASGGRPLWQIARQSRFIVSVLCAISSFAMMSMVMTAAPLAMIGCGHSQDMATLGIQWHSLAMFGPSLVTGNLIVRFGANRVVACGLVLLIGCAIVALSGLSVAHFWLALVFLGVGWNFGFVGATSMVTETYRPEEKSKVQALNDFLVFGSVAVASFSSGKLLAFAGWGLINAFVIPIALLCLIALFVMTRKSKQSS